VVERQRGQGASLEDLCADLLGPTARLLEEYWKGDACGLTDLTLGMGNLQRVLHDLERIYGEDVELRGLDRRILLAAVPGERHPFGISMLSAVFHRAGWDVADAIVAESFEAVVRLVGEEAVPVVGLWLGTTARPGALAEGLDAVRRAAAHRPVRILLAGPACTGAATADLARVGADALAETAPAAVEQAERLLDAKVEHS
jgi:methanogenic corrinoid protein MtbC1